MAEYVCELPIEGMMSFMSGGVLIPVHERIVRCRDCAFFFENATPHDEDCPHFCSLHGIDMAETDGFCKWSARKEVAE